ncbi:MAG TPA: hypothetical protein VIG29_14705 [Vicinamibacteria bacterium]|jgi:hypothetical protein
MSRKSYARTLSLGAALAAVLLPSAAYSQGVKRPKTLLVVVQELQEKVAALEAELAAETEAREDGDAATLADANAYTDSVVEPSPSAISKSWTGSNSVTSGVFTTILFIADVPAGSYVAVGVVNATQNSTGLQCDLEVSSLATGEGFRTPSSMSGSLGLSTLSQVGAITLSEPGRAFIACVGFGTSPMPTVTRATIALVPVPDVEFP